MNLNIVAMVNKNILKVRKKLDRLDDSLLIIIKKRISIILKNISNKSKKNKIDPKITKKIWKSMIKAFIDYEYRNFKK